MTAFSQSGEKWATGLNSVSGTAAFGTLNLFPINFKTNNLQRMTLTTAGFLGIGTVAPTVMFEVAGDGKIYNFNVLDNLIVGNSLSVKKIFSTNGTVDFDGSNIITSGKIKGYSVSLTSTNSHITSTTGTVDFDGNNLSTTGTISANNLNVNNFTNPVFAGSGSGIVTFDNNGTFQKLNFNNNPNTILLGNGTFADLPANGWSINGNDMYSIPSGNIGIGTSLPIEKLDVDGNANIRGTLYVQNGVIIGQRVNSQKVFTDSLKSGKIVADKMTSDSIFSLNLKTDFINTKSAKVFNINIDGNNNSISSNAGYISFAGNNINSIGSLGCENLSVSNTITVNGVITSKIGLVNFDGSNITTTGTITSNNFSSPSFSNSGNGIISFDNSGNFQKMNFNGDTNTVLRGDGTFSVLPANGWSINGNDMISLPSGNIGIGTSLPTTKLDVAGNFKAYTGSFNSLAVSNNLNVYGSLSVDGIITSKIGNVNFDGNNISTTGTITATNLNASNFTNPIFEGSGNGIITFDNNGTFQKLNFNNDSNTILLGNGTFGNLPANVWNINGNDMYSILSGNIGIGTLLPAAKLDVAGNLKAYAGSFNSLTVSSNLEVYGSLRVDGVITSKIGNVNFDGNNISTTGTITATNLNVSNFTNPVFAGSGSGIVTFDNNGTFQKLNFNNDTSMLLRGDGTFGKLPVFSLGDSINAKVITSSNGKVDFIGSNITTAGTVSSNNMVTNKISSISGVVGFGNNSVVTTGSGTFGDVNCQNLFVDKTITVNGVITSKIGLVNFDGSNISTSGTITSNSFTSPAFSGSGSGLVTFNSSGSFQKLNFNGNQNNFLRGDGTFGPLSGTSNWDTIYANAIIGGYIDATKAIQLDGSITAGSRGYGGMGQYSIVVGGPEPTFGYPKASIASGKYSVSFGAGNESSNLGSMSFGGGNTSSGLFSVAFGANNVSDDTLSFTAGSGNTASGAISFIMSKYSSTDAKHSAVIGGINNHITSAAVNSVIIGGTGIMATEPNTVYVPNLITAGSINAGTMNISKVIIDSSIVNALHVVDNLKIGSNSLFLTSVNLPDGNENNIFSTEGNLNIQSTNGNIYHTILNAGINNTGYVGIGTDSPYKKLTVNGDVSFANYFSGNADENPGNGMSAFEILGNNQVPTRRGISLDSDPNGNLNFWIHTWQSSAFNFMRKDNDNSNPSSTNLMTILKNGDIGIGTNNPKKRLHVKSKEAGSAGAGQYLGSIRVEHEVVNLGTTSTWDLEPIVENNETGLYTRFSIGTPSHTEMFTIKDNGNVGIGTTNPIQTLDVNGRMNITNGVIQKGGQAITNTGDLGLYSRDANSYMRFVTNNQPINFYSDAATSNGIGSNVNMTIAPNGNVGIGTGSNSILSKFQIGSENVKICMGDGFTSFIWPQLHTNACYLGFNAGRNESTNTWHFSYASGSTSSTGAYPGSGGSIIFSNTLGEMRFVGIHSTGADQDLSDIDIINSTKLLVTNDGVCIGSPYFNFSTNDVQFAVKGTSSFYGDLNLKASEINPDDPGDIIFKNNSDVTKARIWSNNSISTGLYFNGGKTVNGQVTNDLSIDENGHIGIGMNPTFNSKLSINNLNDGNWGYSAITIFKLDDGDNNGIGLKTNNEHWEIATISTPDDPNSHGLWFYDKNNIRPVMSLNSANGYVGIGTVSPCAPLTVNGKILAAEVEVKTDVTTCPDYVFAPDYKLSTLQEIEKYIKQNSHLPDVPSAKDFEKNGQNLGEMNFILLKKVEELTLHLIEQSKQIEQLKVDNKKMNEEMSTLKNK